MLRAMRVEEGSMEWVFENWRRKRVPSIDRGRMLVYSDEEWLFRCKRQGRQFAAWILIIFAMETYIFAFINEITFPTFIQVVVAVTIGGVIIYILYYLAIPRSLSSGRSLPGIYERGIELWILGSSQVRTFLPFDEIEGTSWRKVMTWEVLTLHMRNSPKKININPHYYGVDGLRFVDDVVHGRVNLAEPPPRLVVYGPHGGM
jgi:hypothetical protein